MAIAPRNDLRRFLRRSNLRDRYVAAVLKMKSDGVYQVFVDWHNATDTNTLPPPATISIPEVAHDNLNFLAWHRAFIRLFEIELQNADLALQRASDPGFDADKVISLPFWPYQTLNSTNPAHGRGRLWKDNFLGPNGTGVNNIVASGPFRSGSWLIEKRDNPNLTVPSVHVPETLPGPELRRELGASGRPLPNNREIRHVTRTLSVFDDNSFTNYIFSGTPGHASASSTASHRAVLEGWRATGVRANESQLHNGVHVWVGGHMGSVPVAPNDPVFFLHHCNIDRMWAMWQVRHPTLAAQHPSGTDIDTVRAAAARPPRNEFARKLSEPMEPWTSAGRRWEDDSGTLLFTTDVITARDVLKWTSMGGGLGGYRIRGVSDRRIGF